MLVAAGASLTMADKDRQTPRILAERAGDSDLAMYLESELILKNFPPVFKCLKDFVVWLGQENFHKTPADNVETSV